MKRLIEVCFSGIAYMIGDDLISFYAFFTTLLAECAYLWAFHSSSIAIPFTIILIGYIVNVIVMGWLKGMWEGERKEVVFSVLYVLIAVGLFAVGCVVDVKMNICLTLIALAVAGLSIAIREEQDTIWIGMGYTKLHKIGYFINSLFRNKVFWLISQIIVIGAPYVTFVVFFAMIPAVPIALKIIVPIVYFILMPFIAYIEDEIGANNIFQIAFDITWDKEMEDWRKTLNKKVIEADAEDVIVENAEENIIRRSCTDEIGTTYCASSIQFYENENED